MANMVHSPEKKARLVIEILSGEQTISEIGAREGISPKQLGNWKSEFMQNAYRAFSLSKSEKAAEQAVSEALEREQTLLAKIGQLTYELDWVKKKYSKIHK